MKPEKKKYLIAKLKPWGYVALYLLAWFLAAMFIAVALLFIPASFLEDHEMLIGSAVMLLGTLIVTYLFCKYLHGESFSDIGLTTLTTRWKDFGRGLLYGAAAMLLGFGFCYFMGIIHISDVHFPLSVFISFVTFVIVAFNEEIMMRGYVLRRFMSAYNGYFALAFSAALFMLMHGLNGNLSALGLVNLFLAGILLGMYYIHKQNLWFPIALHFTWNFFQGPVFGFAVSGTATESIIIQQPIAGKDWLTGGAFGFEGSLPCTFIVVALTIIVHYRFRNKRNLISSVSQENHNVIDQLR